jgi:predicted nucleic acid-binding protein
MKSGSAVCVDAGLVVRRVVAPEDAAIQAIWNQWDADGQTFIAPLLQRYEVTNAIHQYRKAGALTAFTAQRALRAALDLPIQLYSEATLSIEALTIAGRFTLPAAYDAHYLALSERFSVEFWTTDRRLFNTLRASLPWVRLVGS